AECTPHGRGFGRFSGDGSVLSSPRRLDSRRGRIPSRRPLSEAHMFDDLLRAGAVMLLAVSIALAADVSGKWEFSVETSQGSGSPSFVLKQQGEKLTGTYSGLLGSAEVTGIVKGNEIEFTFDTDQAGKVRYKGTIESATRMRGEVEYGDLGKGTFTASKK